MVKSTHLEGLSSFAFKGAFIGGYFERTAALDARMEYHNGRAQNAAHRRKFAA